METKEKKNENRVYYLDYLRILAILAVIFEHNGTPFFWRSIYSIDWKIENIYECLIRWCVPIFVMISGSLFLRRDIPIRKLYSKYVLRMVIAYFVWSLFYLIVSREPSQSVLEQFLFGQYHMWFIRMIVVIYMIMPLLKKITENTTFMKWFLILILGAWLTCALIVCMIRDFWNPELVESHWYLKAIYSMRGSSILGFICLSAYFVLGYFLSRVDFPRVVRYIIYALGLLGVIATYKIEYMHVLSINRQSELYYTPNNVHILFVSMAMFVLFRYLPLPKSRFISTLSKCTFGAYWIHPFVIQLLGMAGIRAGNYSPLVGIFVIGAIVSIISFGISFILNKIPVVKVYLV